jgi:hypothetical protein
MSLLRFVGFNGANLALHPMLIPSGVGVACTNQRPGRGDLRPSRAPSTVASVAGGSNTIYRMGRDAVSDSVYWLAWSADVNVARGMVAGDTVERTFWTGDGQPKWTDSSIGLSATPYPTSTGVRLLGVPVPNATPSLSETVAGAGDDEARAYVVTWVNDREEESEPSAAVTITTKPGSTILVTRNATVPSGAHGLTKWRVYRTVAGAEGEYMFVAEVVAATASVSTTDAMLNSFNPLPSADWTYPPAGLSGIKALWNGIHAGFVEKDLYFSEPYLPFAWPEANRVPLDDEIVALGRWRTNLVVLTKGNPYIVTGSTPGAMRAEPVEISAACVAKLGVVEFGHGVCWPSREGLNYLGEGGYRLCTVGKALPEDWLALAPSTLVAGRFNGMYVGSYELLGVRRSIMVDPLANPADPIGLWFSDSGFTACHNDELSDNLYVLNSGSVQKWDAGTVQTATFDSRTERLARPESMVWGQVLASAYPVTLSVWSDGVLALNAASVTSSKPFRIARGHRGHEWKIRISVTGASGAVQSVALAGSIQELKQVP